MDQSINLDCIPVVKLEQLQFESDTWKRLLGDMVDENVRLKMRLSELLKDKFNQNLLEDAENFQSRFLKEDELIALLRNDMAELGKVLKRETAEEVVIKEVYKKLKVIKENIKTVEKHLSTLQLEFNNYIAENIE
jgi:hypothetical protein